MSLLSWIFQMNNYNNIFERLKKSPFRSKFKLSSIDKQYIMDKGIDTIQKHTTDFIQKRIAPEFIENDGKQTPIRGHPTFVAQHATACCCRGCIHKWHHIPIGRELTLSEQKYLVDIIMTWIKHELSK